MGVLTTAAGLARVVGPIAFSRSYQNEGLYLTIGIVIGFLALALAINVVTYRRYKVVIDRWGDYEERMREEEMEQARAAAAAAGEADKVKVKVKEDTQQVTH